MDKNRIRKMALASGLELKIQADGSRDLNDYIYKLADTIEAEVYRDIEPHQNKDWSTIMALREKVSTQESEIVNLKRAIAGAREILNGENGCEERYKDA